eukprot:1535438-Pyramimonas_sp.AAC.1
MFVVSPFRFQWQSEASRWLQDGPREPQVRVKRTPRRPQERSKRIQKAVFGAPEGEGHLELPSLLIDVLQDGP